MGREAQRWPLHFPRVKTGIVERESRKIAKCKKDEDIVFVSNMKFAMHCILFALINGELHGKSWHKMFANSVETVCERLWKQQTIKVTVMVLVLAAARTSYIRCAGQGWAGLGWAGLGCSPGGCNGFLLDSLEALISPAAAASRGRDAVLML